MNYETYSKIRDEAGYTDARVAKETGIAPATLSAWRSGAYTPKVEKLIKIADLFGVTLDALAGR